MRAERRLRDESDIRARRRARRRYVIFTHKMMCGWEPRLACSPLVDRFLVSSCLFAVSLTFQCDSAERAHGNFVGYHIPLHIILIYIMWRNGGSTQTGGWHVGSEGFHVGHGGGGWLHVQSGVQQLVYPHAIHTRREQWFAGCWRSWGRLCLTSQGLAGC